MATPLGIRKLGRRAVNRVRFEVGQYLLRGAFHRLVVIATFVLIVAGIGGAAEWLLDRDGMPLGEAVWWAFLRLTDPGYLGDDVGFGRRAVSTILTIVGYVLFLGALVAIMTQWLNQTLRRLESGLTPIARDGHVVVAGWTDRTVSVLREMFRSESRSHSLLGGRGTRLNAVVLSEHASPELHQELRERMGEFFREQQLILRQGEAIHLDHLRRADFAHAAAIVLPGDPFLSSDHAPSDVRTVKTLMSIARHLRSELTGEVPPLIVAELFDARRERIAKAVYPGRVEVVVSDRLIGRMLALNLRHRGLGNVYRELLFEGSGQRVHVAPVPAELVGKSFGAAVSQFSDTVLLGFIRGDDPSLCPEAHTMICAGDRLVTFGRDAVTFSDEEVDDESPRLSLTPFAREAGDVILRSLLVLGWTRKVPAVLDELACALPNLTVEVLSGVSVAEREADFARTPLGAKISLTHLVGDYTLPDVLAAHAPARFDAILIVGSDRLESGAESDARTVVGFEVLKHCLRDAVRVPHVLLELTSPENEKLVDGDIAEVLVSPQMLGRVLAQVALVPELCGVYDELFGAGGAELSVHNACEYGFAPDAPLRANALRNAAARVGHVLLGVQMAGSSVVSMNPAPDAQLGAAGEVRIVVALRTE